jgi:hypothetical protein
MEERASLLRSLISIGRPVSDIVSDLRQFPWDSKLPLVQLSPSNALSIMRRYESGQLSNTEVEEWANAIEGRDDIDIARHPSLRELIFQLANPTLTQPLTPELARDWIKRLSE